MPGVTIVRSTADLTPDGILGYAKGFAVTLGAILVAIAEVVGEDWEYNRWLQFAIGVCTIIATIAIPNRVEPVAASGSGAVPPTDPVG